MSELYTYKLVNVIKVSDGDTLSHGGIDLGFGTHIMVQKGRTKTGKPTYYSIRFYGVNAPETRRGWWSKGLSEEEIASEIEAGKEAKAWVTDMVESADEVRIRSMARGPDNFGRLLAVVYVVKDDVIINLCERLLELGLAKPYIK